MQSFWMLASALAFSFCALCIKMCAEDFSGYEMVFYRNILTMAIMFAVMLYRGIPVSTSHAWGHFTRSTSGFISMIFWTLSLIYLPLGTSQTLNNTSPLFMAVFSIAAALFTKKPVPWRLSGSIVLGFAGICFILKPDFTSAEFTGVAYALLSAGFGALAFWAIKELSQYDEPSERIVFYLSVYCTVYSFGCILLFGDGFSPLTLQNAPWLVGIGIFATLGQLFTTLSYGKGNFLLTAALSYTNIIFAWLFGMAIFGDPFDWKSLAGMFFVILAGLYSTVSAHLKFSFKKS